MSDIQSSSSQTANLLERTLYGLNSLLVFWFFAFLITGPKSSLATTVLLALSLITLPATVRMAPKVWAVAAPWLIGLGAYCAYQIAYRLIDGGMDARLDPPARYLGAIPVLFYLSHYGFSIKGLWAGLAVGCIVGGLAGAQEVLIDGAPRAGVGHHPIAYGSILALMTVAALHGATTIKTKAWQTLLYAGFIVGLIGALLSGTRGLYPALAACIAYVGYRQLKQHAMPARTIFLWVLAALSAITVIASQIPAVQKRFEQTQSEITRISKGNLETSFGHRLQMWHAGLYIISQRPIFGLGPEVKKRLPFTQDFMAANKYNKSVLTRYDHLHNLFINEAASFGLAGLAVLGGLLFGAIRGVRGEARGVITLALIIILIEGLTENVLGHQRFLMAFVILATVIRARQIVTESREKQIIPDLQANPAACGGDPAPRWAGNTPNP
jgi:O-antigen ligase